MISRILGWLQAKGPDVHRARRAYLLRTENAVLVPNRLALIWLEDDYKDIYGCFPVLRFHPHPALRGEQVLVSLQHESRID